MNAKMESILHLTLNSGETFRPRLEGRGEVHVQEGQVWLTRRDDPRDYLLAAGDSIALGGIASWGVEATANSKVDIVQSACSRVEPGLVAKFANLLRPVLA